MELKEYPLLHQVDLMLALLKVAATGRATLDDALARLKGNLRSVGEALPVPDSEIREELARALDRLVQALLLEPVEADHFVITPRGMKTLAEHPGGVDDSVLMRFPEFRAFIDQESARPAGRKAIFAGRTDDPRIIEYDEGYVAFHDGQPLQANPYEADRVMHLAWENGWSQARDDALRGESWSAAVRKA
ncbi:hypothetical protein JL100_005365 [Skermanella mucosa]|uniref:ribosome modulation factor n=1 Tax=Skermanella mucosa TaxID=1789672 RepID=UPI001E410CFC|nr:Rmf/CrpP family protein [Skermanella mucosa]UEM22180.1 hypothetical protein JL100_005365 [Skermanella mucosa]